MIVLSRTSAPTDNIADWSHIKWDECYAIVQKLQFRIVKATQERRWNKVKALQHLLVHSFSAKALAVRRVVENKGKKTPGVDKETWSTPKSKFFAIQNLKRRGYKPKPLRRVTIAKSNGGKRLLGIPTMKDRAMQALYALALEPVAETIADKHSYGFRKERSTADAISQCFVTLADRRRAEWILEADIRKCFDTISHKWLIANVPMDKAILTKWLKAGYMESKRIYPTEEGTPQGGIISPLLANITLDGIDKLLEVKFSKVSPSKPRAKINYVRYCDDFIITGRSKELLEQEVKPLVEEFLQQRGLSLSAEKTKITHINDGFDFLGQNIRKYKGKLIIKPSQANVRKFLKKISEVIKENKAITQEQMIRLLNPIIRGWANYHRHVCSSSTFSMIGHKIWYMLWRWSRFRHPTKSARWVKEKYFRKIGNNRWCFAFKRKIQDKGKTTESLFCLEDPTKTPIKRHVKIKSECNPFDPKWQEYLKKRFVLKTQVALNNSKKSLLLWKEQNGLCPVCNQKITDESPRHIHHILERSKGGNNSNSNLVLIHPVCHRQIHVQNIKLVKPAPKTKGL